MGVPKFYRWLSERYPCLSQVIREHQIPEFDNLYLDMNGIIHPCSHPNDDDPHFRITEADIFKNIFNYIEVLFRIIKPKRNFFMAVDGCAPRAKMNQQRSRRFRTAKDAEDNIRKALLKGQTLPSEDRFDSNCITPGTEFMARLQIQLKYFVNKKISTDPLWQNCTVYLSGHDVPGEGEHKIMDFIRYCKSKPGYDPNTRHCLYGLDADLIVLGLTAHEPHFALLREEVRFGKQAKHMIRPEQQTFHLLHLSLLREYIDFEFSSLKPSLHFTYDLEKLIDDWVVLGFLVGNDFVPHLPHMHINQDALPYLFEVYKEFICSTDGYINNGGELNLFRLKKFFELLSKFDRDRFDEVYADLKWLESKTSGDLLNNEGTPQKKKFSKFLVSLDGNEYQSSPVKTKNTYSVLSEVSGAYDDFSFNETPEKSSKSGVRTGDDDDGEDVEIEDEETFELEFKQHKRHYYMEKFDMDIVDDDQIQIICHEYMLALQWIAHYYFNGLQSWSWYYPYHYAPYISDVAKFQVRQLDFDIAKPFLPFEQLLAVLPSGSRKLLPTAFQHLMIMDNSPIIDYYPPDFRTDLNGKQQEWEAVVLIPFIDEVRLLKAMLPNYAHLTDEEKERNSFGKCFVYSYDKALNFVYPSSYPQHFPDITMCKAKVEELDRGHFHLPISMLKKGMMEGTLLDVYFPGFPTMKHLEHTSYLKKAGVKVFQQHSRNKSMIVKIFSKHKPAIEDVSKNLVGKIAHVEWPYMVEALVTSVCNDSIRYYLDHNNQLQSKLLGGDEYKSAMREMKGISSHHMERKGVELGDVKVLVEAKLLHGQRYIFHQKGNLKLEKEWSSHSTFYDLKTVVKDLSVHHESTENYASIEELYTPGSSIFMMAPPYYGASGEVLECDRTSSRVRVALKVLPEPDFNLIIKKYDSLAVHYISDRAVAQRLGISTYLLGCITGDVCIYESEDKNKRSLANIGLRLKYSGQNKEALGFAKRSENGWTYSPKTINILRSYMENFPDVFEAIQNGRNPFVFFEMFPKQSKSYLEKISAFLKEQVCYNVTPVRCGSNILDQPIVQKIEEALEKVKSKEGTKIVKVKIKPHLLFRVTEQFGRLMPDPNTDFMLFDRVVNVENGITVPVGLRGTVVGIHEVPTVENDKNSPHETRYEILFDESFLGAVACRSKEKQGYFLSGCSLLNITYGERKERQKKNMPLSTAMIMQSKISQTTDKNGRNSPAVTSQDATHSPIQVLSKPHNNRKSTSPEKQHSNSKGGLVAPDYWLKGSYSNKPSLNMEKQIHLHSNNQQVKDNNDFLMMWKEMEKTDQSARSPENTGVDQNATAVLQKLLHLPSQNPSPVPSQQPRQVQPRPYCAQNSMQYRPFGYVMSGMHQNLSMYPNGNPQKPIGAPVINPIRLPATMFPITPVPVGVSNQPSRYQIYQPPYIFTPQPRPYQQSQQQDRTSSPRYTKSYETKKAMQTKNSESQFHTTSNKENPFVPHQVVMKNRSSANTSTSSIILPESPSSRLKGMLGVSETEGAGDGWSSDSVRQGSVNLEEKDNNLKELIGIPVTKKQSEKQSQSKEHELTGLIGLMSSVPTSPPSNDDKLKELLGITQPKRHIEENFADQMDMASTDDMLKRMLGVSTSQANKSVEEDLQYRTADIPSHDDTLKKMLGVGISQTSRPIEQNYTEQIGMTSLDDDTLKKVIGVGVSQDKQSSEDYLKNILGVKPVGENSEPKVDVRIPNETSSVSSTMENKELVDCFNHVLVTNNISSNVKPSQSPVTRTVQSNASKSPVTMTTSPEETKKKTHILLAPSFFGTKKK